MPLLLSGGRVDSRNPVAGQGELRDAQNCHYLPGDPRLRSNDGRKKFTASALGAAVEGLRFLRFGGANDRLVGLVGAALHSVEISGLTGTFAPLLTLDAIPSHLTSTRFRNEHLLFTGVHLNQIMDSLGILRRHGFAALVAPAVTELGTSGGPAGGTYQWWVTPFDRNTGTEGAALDGTSLFVTGNQVQVLQPVMDSRATHWRVYRTVAGGAFPNGNRVDGTGTGIPVADTSFNDTGQTPGLSYPLVTTTFAGVTTPVSKNGEPPKATFGFRVDDSLVTNDIDSIDELRYSFPGEPESFPAGFALDVFDDEMIGGVGFGTFGVALADSKVFRLNSVSISQDAEFARGRIVDEISPNFGCPSPLGYDKFNTLSGPRLAWMSRGGAMVTNGSVWDTATDDVDWKARLEPSRINKVVLVNNPANRWFDLYYTPKGGSANTERIRLSYDPFHLKGRQARSPGMKVMGIDTVPASAATAALISNAWEVLTGHTDGEVYRENVGGTDESGGDGMKASMSTSRKTFGTPGSSGHLTRIYVDHEASGNHSVKVKAQTYVDPQGPLDDVERKMSVSKDIRSSLDTNAHGDEVEVTVSNDQDNQGFVLSDIIADYKSDGESEPSEK